MTNSPVVLDRQRKNIKHTEQQPQGAHEINDHVVCAGSSQNIPLDSSTTTNQTGRGPTTKSHNAAKSDITPINTEAIPEAIPSTSQENTDHSAQDHAKEGYHLLESSRRTLKKLGADEVTYKVHLPPHMQNIRMADALHQVYAMFEELIGKLKTDLHPNDKIRVLIQSPKLHAPIHTKATGPNDFSTERVLTEIEKVIQSEENLPIDSDLRINIATIKPKRHGRGHTILKLADRLKKKRSIVEIVNPDDNLCLERAIIVCMSKIDDTVNKKKLRKLIRRVYTEIQYRKARELRYAADIDDNIKTTVQDLKIYEELLDVQIVVIDADNLDATVYAGSRTRTKKSFYFK